jgi:hypothetical protein
MGGSLWDRFKRGRKEQEWYYRGLLESLCGAQTTQDLPFCAPFREVVDILFEAEPE